MIIFRPQLGDILYGKIIDSNPEFISVDCEIIVVKVPTEQIMKPSQMYF